MSARFRSAKNRSGTKFKSRENAFSLSTNVFSRASARNHPYAPTCHTPSALPYISRPALYLPACLTSSDLPYTSRPVSAARQNMPKPPHSLLARFPAECYTVSLVWKNHFVNHWFPGNALFRKPFNLFREEFYIS